MTGQQTLVVPGPEFDHDRLRAMEVDLTPYAVVEQGLAWLRDELEVKPRSLLDPCAGSGVFCKAARSVWPDAWISAIEPREEERPNLERWADQVWIGTFEDCSQDAHDAMSFDLEQQGFDLVATNPPFTKVAEFAAIARRWSSLVFFLAPDDWFQRGAERLQHATDLGLLSSMWWQLLITGAIDFRGGAINPKNGKPFGTDSKSYSWWLWHDDQRRKNAWMTEVLPRLSGEQRRWRVRPGSEDA